MNTALFASNMQYDSSMIQLKIQVAQVIKAWPICNPFFKAWLAMFWRNAATSPKQRVLSTLMSVVHCSDLRIIQFSAVVLMMWPSSNSSAA